MKKEEVKTKGAVTKYRIARLRTTKRKKKVEIFIEEGNRQKIETDKSSFVAKCEIMENKSQGSPLHASQGLH